MDNITELLKTYIPLKGFWHIFPEVVSANAQATDTLFEFIFWTCVILFLLVVVPMFYFTVRYNRNKVGDKALSQKDHNIFLEVSWSALPLIYLAVVFFWGFYQFVSLYSPPYGAKELKVVGQKWNWTVDYPEEEISVSGQGAEIGLRLNQPVRFTMISQDVIHSFFIPNARVKQDVVPGRYSSIWFTPTVEGVFPVLCAEYCGDSHSLMMAKVRVMNDEDYNAWIDKAKNADVGISPKELGEKLFIKRGCNACHTLDGTIKIGPSFKGLYGHTVLLEGGKSVVADDAYIRDSILEPAAQIVKGFPNVMPTFKGQLSEKDINALIAFIKSQE